MNKYERKEIYYAKYGLFNWPVIIGLSIIIFFMIHILEEWSVSVILTYVIALFNYVFIREKICIHIGNKLKKELKYIIYELYKPIHRIKLDISDTYELKYKDIIKNSKFLKRAYSIDPIPNYMTNQFNDINYKIEKEKWDWKKIGKYFMEFCSNFYNLFNKNEHGEKIVSKIEECYNSKWLFVKYTKKLLRKYKNLKKMDEVSGKNNSIIFFIDTLDKLRSDYDKKIDDIIQQRNEERNKFLKKHKKQNEQEIKQFFKRKDIDCYLYWYQKIFK